MNDPKTSCTHLRSLIFLDLEGELEEQESRTLRRHLLTCAGCRALRREESRLTDLLTKPEESLSARRPRARTWALGIPASLAALAATLFVFLSTTRDEAQGFILERSLGAALTWQEPDRSAVKDSNHISLSRQESVAISLKHGVEVEAAGPVRFELDRQDETWKIIVLEGSVRVTCPDDGLVIAVSRSGRRSLPRGSHVLTPEDRNPRPDTEQEPEVKLLIAAGQEAFGRATPVGVPGTAERERHAAELEKAVALFRRALAVESIEAEQRNTALFYLFCSLGRLGKHEEAIAVGERWIALHPDDRSHAYVLMFLANYKEELGDLQAARIMRERILELDPDSKIAAIVRRRLAANERSEPRTAARREQRPESASRNESRALELETAGGYLVVCVALDDAVREDRGFLAAAERARRFHEAKIASWDGRDFEALESTLARVHPQNVLFVIRPEILDVNLHRRILLTSSRMDADIFTDFAFGYLTARDGKTVQELWGRIEELHEKGLPSRTWMNVSVTRKVKSFATSRPGSKAAGLLGFEGRHIYLSTDDDDPLREARKRIEALEEAAVIQFTGNGDPQGIWLFGDERNRDRSRHWPFDPEKVGHDPKGEMPRLRAQDLRKLELPSSIVWSGTCHSGTVKRVYVEGDIVSTFGRSETVAVYDLAFDDSLAHAFIDAGAAALLVPIGANHGVAVDMESTFMLRQGASLGEGIKSTYDDVFLAAGGEPVLDLIEAGKKHPRREYVMQGGGANRILIGDPALRPFRETITTEDETTVSRTTSGLDVSVRRQEGWSSRAWDIYGRSSPHDWRVMTRIELDRASGQESIPGYRLEVSRASGDEDLDLPYEATRCFAESYHGRAFLHIQANGERKLVERKPVRVDFKLSETR